MGHYLFSYDVDTNVTERTQSSDVVAAMCNLVNQGFTVQKLKIDSSYLISKAASPNLNEDTLFKVINLAITDLLNFEDRWVLVRVHKSTNSENVIRVWTTDEGKPIKCPPAPAKRP